MIANQANVRPKLQVMRAFGPRQLIRNVLHGRRAAQGARIGRRFKNKPENRPVHAQIALIAKRIARQPVTEGINQVIRNRPRMDPRQCQWDGSTSSAEPNLERLVYCPNCRGCNRPAKTIDDFALN